MHNNGTEPAITTFLNDETPSSIHKLLMQVACIYDVKDLAEQLNTATGSNWSRKSLIRQIKGAVEECQITREAYRYLRSLLPSRPADYDQKFFRFIDLFAGIGGLRSGFDAIGGKCVFTSEWNQFSRRTYSANWYCDEAEHLFNSDIRDITLSNLPDMSEDQAYASINTFIPDHDVLLAGFLCQPFSIAGVSKKNSLGRKHGFECDTQGTLFFDVARIIRAKQPAIFVLENVKNLKSHDKGNTFRDIMKALDELGYDVADCDAHGAKDPKIIDGKNFRPQHRERIVLVGFRRDLKLHDGFSLNAISTLYPLQRPTLAELLDVEVDSRYTLSPKLWQYLYNYAKKHKAKGNGFGYGLVNSTDKSAICRTLSARYYRDGSEILLDRGWDLGIGEKDFNDSVNMARRPRRLTPRECARLMGFEQPGKATFRIPVSDTQAYRQFGNSVIVDVFAAVANLLRGRIEIALAARLKEEFEAAS